MRYVLTWLNLCTVTSEVKKRLRNKNKIYNIVIKTNFCALIKLKSTYTNIEVSRKLHLTFCQVIAPYECIYICKPRNHKK